MAKYIHALSCMRVQICSEIPPDSGLSQWAALLGDKMEKEGQVGVFIHLAL